MGLVPGTRLGPYEILALLGAGGMGEVYRARDTRLDRDVAVKVLPQHLSSSPDDRARFKREAKAISTLNHPHICVLHDVGQEGETDYLVMELVEGETLGQRLARGPMPTIDVLKLGAQVADALDRAHRSGVTHRDLKPGNVMLTKSGAKLMDFGLARPAGRPARGADDVTETARAGAPKSDEPITSKGTVVGTFQYMAPEQLEGMRADARSDLWALGCVLYEMATGQRAFEGSTQASLISAIMRDEPRHVEELAPLTPAALGRVVRQCLAKDPDDRWQTAGDLRRELLWIAEAGSRAGTTIPVQVRRKSLVKVAWVLGGIAMAAGVGLAIALLQPRPTGKAAIFQVIPPPVGAFLDFLRVSPDGKAFAFTAVDYSGGTSIWLRPLNSLEARCLPGTEGATWHTWSPNSRSLAFFAGKRLYKIDIDGGTPLALCDLPEGAGRQQPGVFPAGENPSWSSRGVILFAGEGSDSIRMVPASGGAATGATRLSRTTNEFQHSWPMFLPDGRHFLYIASGKGAGEGTLMVGSIDSREAKSLGPITSRVEYSSGHILYVRGGTLLAQAFDTRALTLKGEPFPVAKNVEGARFATSSEGTLVYRSGVPWTKSRLTWVNRRGERIGTVGSPGYFEAPALSPDGTQLAAMVVDSTTRTMDIWTWDIARNVESRLTFTNRYPTSPVWSPNSTRIAYGDEASMRFKSIGGTRGDSMLNVVGLPTSWSNDDSWVTYATAEDDPNWDIYALSLRAHTRPVPVAVTPSMEVHAALSPDSKWVAYASSESGQLEIYVQSFPNKDRRWRVSTNGGFQPSWRGDGRELFYLTPGREMMSVRVEPGPPPRFSIPQKLFDAPVTYRVIYRNCYAVTRDGQRFMLAAREGERNPLSTTVVFNWPALHKRN